MYRFTGPMMAKKSRGSPGSGLFLSAINQVCSSPSSAASSPALLSSESLGGLTASTTSSGSCTTNPTYEFPSSPVSSPAASVVAAVNVTAVEEHLGVLNLNTRKVAARRRRKLQLDALKEFSSELFVAHTPPVPAPTSASPTSVVDAPGEKPEESATQKEKAAKRRQRSLITASSLDKDSRSKNKKCLTTFMADALQSGKMSAPKSSSKRLRRKSAEAIAKEMIGTSPLSVHSKVDAATTPVIVEKSTDPSVALSAMCVAAASVATPQGDQQGSGRGGGRAVAPSQASASEVQAALDFAQECAASISTQKAAASPDRKPAKKKKQAKFLRLSDLQGKGTKKAAFGKQSTRRQATTMTNTKEVANSETMQKSPRSTKKKATGPTLRSDLVVTFPNTSPMLITQLQDQFVDEQSNILFVPSRAASSFAAIVGIGGGPGEGTLVVQPDEDTFPNATAVKSLFNGLIESAAVKLGIATTEEIFSGAGDVDEGAQQ